MTVHLEGWDGDVAAFAVESASRKGRWYEVWVVADNGNASCGVKFEDGETIRGCEDRQYRRRTGNLVKPANPCKHIAEVLRRLQVALGMSQQGATADEIAALLDDRFKGFLA